MEAGFLWPGEPGDDGVGALDALVVADDDSRAGRSEEPRAGGADAARGAGDDRDLAVERFADLRRHAPLPRWFAAMLSILAQNCHRARTRARGGADLIAGQACFGAGFRAKVKPWSRCERRCGSAWLVAEPNIPLISAARRAPS